MLVFWRSAGQGCGRLESGRWKDLGRRGSVAGWAVERRRRRRGREVYGDIVANEVRRDAVELRMAEIGE